MKLHSRMFLRNVVHIILISQCDREKKSTSTTKFSTRQLYTAVSGCIVQL